MKSPTIENEVSALLPSILKSIKGANPVVAMNALYRAMEIVQLTNSGVAGSQKSDVDGKGGSA